MTIVFVYGTLKRGQPNHELIQKYLPTGKAKFLGTARTMDSFPLIIHGKYNIPYFLLAKGIGHRIVGEVYDADEDTMRDLDRLEEYPKHYQKEYIEVEFLPQCGITSTKTIMGMVYVEKEFNSKLLDMKFYENYDSYGDHGRPYLADHQLVDSGSYIVDTLK